MLIPKNFKLILLLWQCAALARVMKNRTPSEFNQTRRVLDKLSYFDQNFMGVYKIMGGYRKIICIVIFQSNVFKMEIYGVTVYVEILCLTPEGGPPPPAVSQRTSLFAKFTSKWKMKYTVMFRILGEFFFMRQIRLYNVPHF